MLIELIQKGVKKKEKTKEYFKNLIDELEIQSNTIKVLIEDNSKSIHKLKHFYKKVITKIS